MSNSVTIASAARRTRYPQRRIREWCATGSLACEPVGADWLVPLSQLPLIEKLVADEDAALAERRVTAVALPEPVDVPSALRAVVRGTGQPADAITVERLALDGRPYLVLAWEVTLPEGLLGPLGGWVGRAGGLLLERTRGQ